MDNFLYHASYQPPEVILKEGLKVCKSRFDADPKTFFASSPEETFEHGPYIYQIDPEGLDLDEEGGYVFTRMDVPPIQIQRWLPEREEEE